MAIIEKYNGRVVPNHDAYFPGLFVLGKLIGCCVSLISCSYRHHNGKFYFGENSMGLGCMLGGEVGPEQKLDILRRILWQDVLKRVALIRHKLHNVRVGCNRD